MFTNGDYRPNVLKSKDSVLTKYNDIFHSSKTYLDEIAFFTNRFYIRWLTKMAKHLKRFLLNRYFQFSSIFFSCRQISCKFLQPVQKLLTECLFYVKSNKTLNFFSLITHNNFYDYLQDGSGIAFCIYSPVMRCRVFQT